MGATLEIGDDVLWGKLVKSWATGRNYVVPDGAPFPIPRTLDELLAIAKSIDLAITFPDGMVGLAVIQYSPQTAVIKLPPKAMVEDTEARLREPDARARRGVSDAKVLRCILWCAASAAFCRQTVRPSRRSHR